MGIRIFFATIVDLRQRFDEAWATVATTTVVAQRVFSGQGAPRRPAAAGAVEGTCDAAPVEKRQRPMLQCNIGRR